MEKEEKKAELLKARAHVYVSGRVQGVFFRSETQDEARRQDITGWVRNLADGRVEAVFEGEKDKVEALVEFCRRGPPGARVSKVDVTWEDYTGQFRSFAMRF
jgi:acylphosphatase